MSDAAGFKVDLTNCDQEPIHVLGNIQPFGFLVAVGADWTVSRASANTAAFIGVPPGKLLGRALSEIFLEKALHTIRNRVTLLRGPDAVERLFNVQLVEGGALFDVALHFSADQVVIEGEPASTEELEASAMVRAMIARLSQAEGMTAYFREGARQVRALTGFDRVKVYRFDDTGAGEVVAESLRPGVDSFLGLHYPASDIPAQARKLYMRNIFRVIADIDAAPVPIEPALDSRGQALDLSLSVTRAVSPIHIEYLKNMGVQASLSISIIADGKLWGLFACHHYSPRLPSFAYRTAAELFGQMFSLMLESRERREASDYEARARAVADRLMATVAQDSDLLNNAQWIGDMVFDTIPADGVGVFLNGTVSLSGLAPDRDQFAEVVRALNRHAAGEIFATSSIGSLMPDAAAYADRAAGLIAIPLSRAPRDYVVLFRSEQLRSVRWAGNPEKAVGLGPNGARLTPRKSFELWSQLVKGQSVPFTAAERRVAETLRSGMLEVLVRLSEAAEQERARAHERQELLIAELNHRVRNILALIRGIISQSRSAPSASVEDFIATLDERIRALARAHDQITADRWGPARLVDLIEIETGAYLGDKRERVTLEGPNLLVQPGAFTTLALVFHELMTNAAKYGALSDSGMVTVTWKTDAEGGLLLTWEEKGGPVVTAPTRRGFGSTIIEQSIPFDLGGKASVEYRLGGLFAQFCVPSRHVAGLARGVVDAAKPAAVAGSSHPLDGKRVLLVEDSMIIALDAEDVLKQMGASAVATAASVSRALAMIRADRFDVALLDVNLGAETSATVAEALKTLNVPFIFATGYGEGTVFLRDHPDAPVINKPYGASQMIGALASLGFS
jgi:light-regulated signal transduction histidine kinase (bacteriophytochrome)/CheY-like chemotaxis protein